MKTQNFLKGLVVGVLMFLSLILGWMIGFNEHVSIMKEAKAAEITSPETPAMTTSYPTNYEKVYCYGHSYIIFWKNNNDIEVVQLD